MTGYWWTAWLWWIGGAVVGLLGLWLLYWSLLRDRSKGRRRCPKCWYDMSFADSLRCPECGNDAKREADLLKTRRRWKSLWICLLVFLAASYLWIQPKVKQDGWVSVLPNTALILCLRLEDNQAIFAELHRRTQTPFWMADVLTAENDPESLYKWQWRLIGNACITLRDDPDFLDRRLLLVWMNRVSSVVQVEHAYRYFRATIPFLADDDWVIRRMAATYCADVRFSEEAVEAIRPLLDDAIGDVRVSAVAGLGNIGIYSSAPLPILLDALNHKDAQVRAYTAVRLGDIANTGKEPELVFETLVNVHETDSDVEVRANALGAICKFESRRE